MKCKSWDDLQRELEMIRKERRDQGKLYYSGMDDS
jgi:hypothetical protein